MNKDERSAFMAGQNKTIALGRAGTPVEIAQLALFLTSDKSSHITGQPIVIGGGR